MFIPQIRRDETGEKLVLDRRKEIRVEKVVEYLGVAADERGGGEETIWQP